MSESRIALVYDNLNTMYGGAEVVLKTLLSTFPDAHVYSTVSTLQQNSWLGEHQVTTSFLQKLPGFLRSRHQLHALLAPLAIESLHITEPIVISVSAGVAKGCATRPEQLHICYLLTPTRYLYDSGTSLRAAGITKLPIINWLARTAMSYLRWWDYAAAQRPDRYITISKLVGERLKSTYNRNSDELVYPPFIPQSVEISTPLESLELPEFLLSVGRQVWYKRIDVVIEYSKVSRMPTIIAGEGASAKKWQKLAGKDSFIRKNGQTLRSALAAWNSQKKPILFVGRITQKEKAYLFSKAAAFIMPGVEDFGLTALEALYFGCPAIVNQESGVSEILNGQVALFLKSASVLDITQAVAAIKDMNFSHSLLKQHALRYSEIEFKQQFAQHIQKWSHYVGT